MLLPRNDAVAVNPPNASLAITEHGSDWYWTAFTILALSTAGFFGVGYTKAPSNRAFHYLLASASLVTTVSYFTLASNLGNTGVPVEFANYAAGTREIFYVRYIQWALTTPILTTSLFLTAGLPWQHILFTGGIQETAVVSLLSGSLVPSSYKWGYYTFGVVSLGYVVYTVLLPGRQRAAAFGTDVAQAYLIPAGILSLAWLLYPIAWGVSEGGNVIHPDSEAAFYGVIDILAVPVFGAALLWGHRDIEPARLGVQIRGVDDSKHQGKSSGGVTEA